MIPLPTLSSQHEIFPHFPFDNPHDTVSCIQWIPSLSNSLFLAGGWDCYVRAYCRESRALGVLSVTHTPDPVLSLAMMGDSQAVCGLITGDINMIDLPTNSLRKIGQQPDAVKDLYSISGDLFISLSYDKTLRLWDSRTQIEVMKMTFPHKIYCSDFDLSTKSIALGLSSEKIFVGKIDDLFLEPNREFTNLIDSPLGKGSQLSSISLSKIDPLIALATSDGRANVSKINATNDLSNVVSFKCHKIDPGQGGNTSTLKILYPVHAIEFHPTLSHTLFTAGGEGNLNFWDSLRRDRIRTAGLGTIPITKAAFSPDGKYIAYGKGYDWAKGIQGDKSYPNSIGVHEVQHEEVHNDRN